MLATTRCAPIPALPKSNARWESRTEIPCELLRPGTLHRLVRPSFPGRRESHALLSLYLDELKPTEFWHNQSFHPLGRLLPGKRAFVKGGRCRRDEPKSLGSLLPGVVVGLFLWTILS